MVITLIRKGRGKEESKSKLNFYWEISKLFPIIKERQSWPSTK